MPFKIGSYPLKSRFLLAPMAGITDRPYREVCLKYGAGLAVSEMISSDLSLINSQKSKQRLVHVDEAIPRSVQIVGTDPSVMADAAYYNVTKGANIIDINMGCPAKKVCNTYAGSALMRDTNLVTSILRAVTNKVDIPVTLKIRTGWDTNHRNALTIAQIAEDCGISCLVIHGRTREQAYTGYAEYETIRLIKEKLTIPIIANGDINSVQDAKFIFEYTNVDGLMLGRVTQGQPWIIKKFIDEIERDMQHKEAPHKEKISTALWHINAIHRHYGTGQGVRIARKHIGWYLYNLVGQDQKLLKKLKVEIFSISDPNTQILALDEVLNNLSV